eukprot:298526_1
MRWFSSRRESKSINSTTTSANINNCNTSTPPTPPTTHTNFGMTSYWNSNSKNESVPHQTHKYHKVSTTQTSSTNIKRLQHHNIHNQHSQIHQSHINTIINTNDTLPIADDTDSSLDDEDFPSGEQKSFLSTTTNHNRTKTMMRHPWSNKQLSWFNHFSIGAYWFGWAFLW